LLVPTAGGAEIDAEVIFDGPIQAPVTQGDAIAELVIRLENLPETRVPLVADTTIAAGGFSTRLRTAADVLVERVRTPDADMVEAE
jgi:D-alanyl-D-alanine carboxypeptidase (penicillin-binding protein 5/6)